MKGGALKSSHDLKTSLNYLGGNFSKRRPFASFSHL